jgi:hypothetical protein
MDKGGKESRSCFIRFPLIILASLMIVLLAFIIKAMSESSDCAVKIKPWLGLNALALIAEAVPILIFESFFSTYINSGYANTAYKGYYIFFMFFGCVLNTSLLFLLSTKDDNCSNDYKDGNQISLIISASYLLVIGLGVPLYVLNKYFEIPEPVQKGYEQV